MATALLEGASSQLAFLAAMSECERRDIGLTGCDVENALALPSTATRQRCWRGWWKTAGFAAKTDWWPSASQLNYPLQRRRISTS